MGVGFVVYKAVCMTCLWSRWLSKALIGMQPTSNHTGLDELDRLIAGTHRRSRRKIFRVKGASCLLLVGQDKMEGCSRSAPYVPRREVRSR